MIPVPQGKEAFVYNVARWIVPLLGYVLSTAALRAATADIERRGARVPDLIPFGTTAAYREAFDVIVRTGADTAYFFTLLTADTVFPLCYGALLFQLGSRAGRWRYAAVLATACDLLENASAIAIVAGGAHAESLFAAFNWGKWSLLAVAAVAVGWSIADFLVDRARSARSQT